MFVNSPVWNLGKNIIKNRTAQIFVILHWIFFGVALFKRHGINISLAPSDVSAYSTALPESSLALTILVLDFPAILISVVVFLPIGFVILKVLSEGWWILAFLYFVIATGITLQWALIGYGFGKLFGRKLN